MSVSLVKSYFTAGWSLPGCLPESPAALFTTLDDAREYLACALDESADQACDWGDDDAMASFTASAELIRSDRDGDIAWRGSWSTIEPDGYAYWIEPATL